MPALLLCFPVLRLQGLLGVGNLEIFLAEAPRMCRCPRAALPHSPCRSQGQWLWQDPGAAGLLWALQLPGKLGQLQDSPVWEGVGRNSSARYPEKM